MAAYFTDANRSDVFSLASSVGFSQPVPANVYDPVTGWYPNNVQFGLYKDRLFMGWNFELCFPAASADFLLGWDTHNSASTFIDSGPVDEQPYDSVVDWRYYGSFLSGFKSLRGQLSVPSVAAHEGLARHTHFDGDVQSLGGARDLYPKRGVASTIVGTKFPTIVSSGGIRPYGTGSHYSTFSVASVGGGYTFAVSTATNGSTSPSFRVRLEEFLYCAQRDLGKEDWTESDNISAGSVSIRVAYRRFRYSIIPVSATRVEVYVSYDFRCRTVSLADELSHSYAVDHEFILQLDTTGVVPTRGPGAKVPCMRSVSSSSRVTHILIESSDPYGVPPTYGWKWRDNTQRNTWVATWAHFATSGGDGKVNFDLNRLTWNKTKRMPRLRHFNDVIGYIHSHDMRSAAAISSGKAVEGLDSSSNFLESLSEVPEILELLPDTAAVRRVLGKLLKGDLTFVPDLVKLAADNYLLLNFGIRPAAADVSEAFRLATSAVDQMTMSSSSVLSLYGAHKLRIPSEFTGSLGDGYVTVDIRSKVVLRRDVGSQMARFLSLRRLGLAPTASNFWDLVAFSFVADWFTGVGSKISSVDNNLTLLALPVEYYVHTYHYKYHFDVFELHQMGLSTVSDFTMDRFIRDLSFHHPVLGRDGRFDLQPPPDLPKFMASLGALIVANLG